MKLTFTHGSQWVLLSSSHFYEVKRGNKRRLEWGLYSIMISLFLFSLHKGLWLSDGVGCIWPAWDACGD